MTRASGPTPESWDEATDIRRFWWLVPPVTFAILTAVVLSVAGALRTTNGSKQAREEVHEEVRVGERPRVQIENIGGDVIVQADADGIVRVSVQRFGIGASEGAAATNLLALRLNVTPTAQGVTIRVFEDPPLGIAGGTRATITVTVPRLAAVDVHTQSGLVHVVGVDGGITARSDNGNLDIEVDDDPGFLLTAAGPRLTTDFDMIPEPGSSARSIKARVGQNPERSLLLSSSGTILLRRSQ